MTFGFNFIYDLIQLGTKSLTRQGYIFTIAADKRGIHIIFFLFLHENVFCGNSLEAPHLDAANENPQHMFLWRNKKISVLLIEKKVPHLELYE